MKKTLAIVLLSAVPTLALAGPGAPQGWFITGSKPAEYEFGTEPAPGSPGQQSAYIKAKPNGTSDGFGTLMQTIKADKYIGQRLRLSANLKSENAVGLQIWMRIDDMNGKTVEFYNMYDHPVTGTAGWKRCDVVLDVPPGSATINYGFFLIGGKGEGWADHFAIERVEKTVPVSAPDLRPLLDRPTNLNFDQ